MKRHRHTIDQIVRKLRIGEQLLAEGKDRIEVLRQLEISKHERDRWRKMYGGMKTQRCEALA
ncbi:MAG: hypothetical protein ACYDCC_09940 [Actinomycetota bacterium]